MVVPIGISNHDNIGAIFRNAAAFEADAIFMDETCCEPALPQGGPCFSGCGAEDPLCQRNESPKKLVNEIKAEGFELLALAGGRPGMRSATSGPADARRCCSVRKARGYRPT